MRGFVCGACSVLAASVAPLGVHGDVHELYDGGDLHALVDGLVASGASSSPQTIILHEGTYALTNEVMMTWPLEIRGATGNPSDVIVDVQNRNKAFCLNHAEARLLSLTVYRGRVSEARSYGVVRICEPKFRGNGTNADAGDGVGGLVSNVVMRSCSSVSKGSAGILYLRSGLATHCVMTNCTASGRQYGYGEDQGIFVYLRGGVVRNTLVADNTCSVTQTGGAPTDSARMASVWVAGGQLINATIADNVFTPTTSPQTEIACAGVYSAGGKVVNTLIFGNETGSSRDHYASWAGTAANFVNCASDSDAAINETCRAVSDPKFLGEGDYRLAADSSCSDAGTTASGYAYGETDLAGKPRLRTKAGATTIDIGAYQYDAAVTKLSATAEFPDNMYDAPTVSFAVEASGFGDSPVYYWDFDSDGTIDLTTTDDAFSRTFGLGDYHVTLYASNLTAEVGNVFTFDEGFSVEHHPVHYVDAASKNPVAPYLTKGTAATDIQSAVDVAVKYEEVRIAKGTYEIAKCLYVTNDWTTVGGETGRAGDVIVKAVANTRCLQVDAGTHALVHSLTLANGRCGDGVVTVTQHGQGACLNIARASVNANGSENNPAYGNGGTVSNCIIRGGYIYCKYVRSGGAFLYGPNAFLTHCVISNNTNGGSYSDGGWIGATGLALWNGARASHCLVTGNKSGPQSYYQASVVVGTDSVLDWSTIVGNTSSFIGGVCVSYNGKFEKCAIAGNVWHTVAGIPGWSDSRYGVWCAFDLPFSENYSRPKATAAEADAAYETAEKAKAATVGPDQVLNATDVETAALGSGSVCAQQNVLFRKAATGDYHPRASSPSVNVVSKVEAPDMPSVDLDGCPRFSGGGYDLGAFEHQSRGMMLLVQ